MSFGNSGSWWLVAGGQSNVAAFVRKRIIFLFFSLPLLAFTACARQSQVERANEEGILLRGNGPDPQALDPHLTAGVSELNIHMALFEGLVSPDPRTLAPGPGVAEHWTISEDQLKYVFHLRADAKWSNGDSVTAEDFLFSWKRILHPNLAATNASMLYPIKGAEAYNRGESDGSVLAVHARDAHTLEIELHAPAPYFLSVLMHPVAYPVHPASVKAAGDPFDRNNSWARQKQLVGNGPFAFREWRPKVWVDTVRNPYYWDQETVQLNGIRFLSIEEPSAEERAFLGGQIHVTEALPPTRVQAWLQQSSPELMIDPYLGTYYVLLNTRNPPFNDPRVRRALSLAVDRESIVDQLLGAGQKAAYSFTPQSVPGYNPPKAPEGTLADARRLLAEAGYPEGRGFPKVEYLFNTSDSHRRIAEALQSMWKERLGIDIDLVNQEWRVYLDRRAQSDFQMARAVWIGDYVDAHTFLSLWTSTSGNNWSGWSDAAYDNAVAAAGKTADPVNRAMRFAEAETLLLKEQVVIPLYHYVTVYLKRPEVEGWYPTLLNWHPYKYIRLAK